MTFPTTIVFGALLLAAPLCSQSMTQTVVGGFPSAGAPGRTQIAEHSQGANATRNEMRSLTVPQFDPSLGILQGVSIECRATTSFGNVDFRAVNPVIVPSVSLRGVTNITFDEPTFANPTLTTTEDLNVTFPPLNPRSSATFTSAVLTATPVTVSVPSSAFGSWQGNGTKTIGLNLEYVYTSLIAFITANTTWRPELNAQVSVTYTYGPPSPDGRSTRGLPGCGLASVTFQPFTSTQYTVGSAAFVDPRFRDGEELRLSDDAFVERNLPFPFQMPNGRMVTRIRIDSNGYISDPADDITSDFSPTVTEFLQQGSRIAPCWNDFSPNQAGSVWFRVDGFRAEITWSNVTEYNRGNSNTFQLQLFPSGRIAVLYMDMNLERPRQIVGCSEGNVVGTPPGTDLSGVTQGILGNFPRTVYEAFDGSTDLNTDPNMPVLAAQNAPNIGANYTLELQNQGTAVAATLLFGVPSALNLGFVFVGAPGFEGCIVRVDLNSAAFVPLSLMNGLSVPIPNDPSLRGTEFEFQAVTVDPSVTNALGINLSNALTATVGG